MMPHAEDRAAAVHRLVDVAAIRSAVAVRDVLAAAGCEASSRGRRTRCPIHGGDNATEFSFTESGFHCFACGRSGDVIELAKLLHGLSFTQALAHLARLAGMDRERLPRLDCDRAERRRSVARRRAALHAWRGEQLNKCVAEAEKLDREARRFGEQLTLAQIGGDDSTAERLWDVLATTYATRDALDWRAAQLAEPSERTWLRLLRSEQSREACRR